MKRLGILITIFSATIAVILALDSGCGTCPPKPDSDTPNYCDACNEHCKCSGFGKGYGVCTAGSTCNCIDY